MALDNHKKITKNQQDNTKYFCKQFKKHRPLKKYKQIKILINFR